MPRYWLAAHAYPAAVGPQTIFFDSRNRTFCALRTNWVYSLRTMIEDWAMPETPYGETAADASPQEYAAFMTKRGLLTTVASEGKRMEQLQIDSVQYGAVEHADLSFVQAGPVDAARLLYAGILACWKFRHRTLEHLLQELAGRRKMRNENPAGLSDQRIRRVLHAYWCMRPLLPFGRHTDLIDSWTLVEYLSKYHVFPRLVIGVQLMPFISHTWVQHAETVFNDTPEFVRQFTPIFSA